MNKFIFSSATRKYNFPLGCIRDIMYIIIVLALPVPNVENIFKVNFNRNHLFYYSRLCIFALVLMRYELNFMKRKEILCCYSLNQAYMYVCMYVSAVYH